MRNWSWPWLRPRGVAIENATLLAEGRRRQSWQTAMVRVTTDLLGGAEPEAVLAGIVQSALDVLHVDGAAAAMATEQAGTSAVVVAEGSLHRWLGATLPTDNSILADAVEAGVPVTAGR
ncbi:hypothetical protein [Actinoplanes sp. NPDC049265]|uniref:hypothetical protein n=1 Tax=Actinoplanes sp. NPDC049265 TaxID=3363902 RepID=UPI003719DED9